MKDPVVLVIPTEAEIFYQDLHTKALESAQQPDWYHFTVIEIRWFLFAERLADASAERLSTVSSPYMVFSTTLYKFFISPVKYLFQD
jgi:hypothetical protein